MLWVADIDLKRPRMLISFLHLAEMGRVGGEGNLGLTSNGVIKIMVPPIPVSLWIQTFEQQLNVYASFLFAAKQYINQPLLLHFAVLLEFCKEVFN